VVANLPDIGLPVPPTRVHHGSTGLYLWRGFLDTSAPLTVEIRDVSAGAPGARVLASESVPAADVPAIDGTDWFFRMSFASPATVRAGSQYAIVAHTAGSHGYEWTGPLADLYARGEAFFSVDMPPTAWSLYPGDHAFATYVAPWDFSGFFSPADNDQINLAKAGSSIPVKFSLAGDQGLDVLADGYPKLEFTQCGPEDDVDPIEETSTANNGLTYDASTDTYTYVWKTSKSWSGKCGTLTLKLDDNSVHTADFQFK
jgi:hypothetical protein